MNKAKQIFLFFLGSLFLLAGCRESKISPTKGTVQVEVDSSIAPILQKEAVVFDSLYKNAKLELKSVSPLKGMVNLLNNKVRMFVSPRYFNQKEHDFINKEKLNVKIFKFCYNTIAVIASPKNPIEKIRVDELKDMLTGKRKGIRIVLPQSSTYTYQYIKESVLNGKNPEAAEIVPSDEAVLKRIENSSNEIGMISFNIVQDSSKIKFVKLGELNHNTDSTRIKSLEVNYFTPHPGFVLENYYPFKLTVYIYLNEIVMSPASGFTTFLTNYEGQKIALKENLAPAAVPVKINEPQ